MGLLVSRLLKSPVKKSKVNFFSAQMKKSKNIWKGIRTSIAVKHSSPSNIHMLTQKSATATDPLVYSRKKAKQGGGVLRTYFLKTPLEFFISLLYPWKFQKKQSSTPENSTKLF